MHLNKLSANLDRGVLSSVDFYYLLDDMGTFVTVDFSANEILVRLDDNETYCHDSVLCTSVSPISDLISFFDYQINETFVLRFNSFFKSDYILKELKLIKESIHDSFDIASNLKKDEDMSILFLGLSGAVHLTDVDLPLVSLTDFPDSKINEGFSLPT